jgi:Tol biopolymer transport system component
MSRMMTNIPVILLVGLLAIGLGNCNDSPVRPKETNTCWKPIMADPDSPQPHSTTAVWSPSGKYVVFLGFFDSCNNPSTSLYITETGGKSRTALNMVGSMARWLPPGDSVLIINEGLFVGGELVKYNIETRVRTPLGIQTRLPLFDVSEDGKYVFFEGDPIDSTSAGGIYRFDFSNEEIIPISPGGSPAVSPSGTLLALSKGPLFVFDLATRVVLQLNADGRIPDWTRNSQNIVYRNLRPPEIRVTDLAGQAITLQEGFGAPNVSPDGNWVLYESLSSDNYEHVWITSIDAEVKREFIK